MQKKIILTGDRPTGLIHLGHYVGSILNRLKYQEEYETYIVVADLHSLTTKPDKKSVSEISSNVREIVVDYLACGINPEKSNIYLQSAIPEVYELHLILSMLVSTSRLQRIPSIKEMSTTAGFNEVPYGLLGYPVLMSSDILAAKANLVPVGHDNEANIELARELAKRFNFLYGEEFFPIPEAVLTKVPSLVGIDGKNKMSKSLNNAIFLSDSKNLLYKKIMSMFTDPNRVSADIPGTIEGNPVFIYHDLFNKNINEVSELKERYKKGKIKDIEVKERLYHALNELLMPIREKRKYFETNRVFVDKVIFEGTLKTRKVAEKVVKEVKKVIGLSKTWDSIRQNFKDIYKKTS